MQSSFCYNSKNGNIMLNDKHVIRYEYYCGTYHFYYKKGGRDIYLTQEELKKLKQFALWCMEKLNADFGEPISALIQNDYL